MVTHNQLMHVRMQNTEGYTFDLTVVYGEGTTVKRRPLWNTIAAIWPTSGGKEWLMIGDFNEIRHPSEREGHDNYNRAGANEFESAIDGFTELEAIGGKFTWANGVGRQHTRTKLDRALGNASWIARWPQTRPTLVQGTTSDHAGLLLRLARMERGSTPFKFYNSWLREEESNLRFIAAWEESVEGTPLFKLQQKIKAVKRAAKDWAKIKKMKLETSRRVATELHDATIKLQEDLSNPIKQDKCRALKAKLVETQHREMLDLQ